LEECRKKPKQGSRGGRTSPPFRHFPQEYEKGERREKKEEAKRKTDFKEEKQGKKVLCDDGAKPQHGISIAWLFLFTPIPRTSRGASILFMLSTFGS